METRNFRRGVIALLVSDFWPCVGGSPSAPLPRESTRPVLDEPTVNEYYGFLRNYTAVPLKSFSKQNAPPVIRVTNLEDETFKQMVRDGQPFVVDDCMNGFDKDAVSNFQCKDFGDKWPTGNMRAEYTQGQYHIYLKDPTWYSKVHPTKANAEHMAGKKKIAGPYIWHVKDEEPLKTKREVQKYWRTPYFLKPSVTNRFEANESFEFWFSHAGGGTFTHADAYCETTISMQFKGKKRWRIQHFPEIKNYFNASKFGDAEIYQNKMHVPWTPETEFTVGPGQCFIFPTGYLHETFVDPAENDAECYTAATFQFNHPRQVNLYRAYLSRFSMSHYGASEPCVQGMQSYATLLGQGSMPLTKEPDMDAAMQKAKALVTAVDSDGDGRMTNSEIYKYFCTGKMRGRVISKGGFKYVWDKLLSKAQRQEQQEESLQVWAEDALQYHDLNRDKAVTIEECAHTLLQWHVVQYRSKQMKKLSKSKKKPKQWFDEVAGFEKKILAKHFCKDASNCNALDDLAAADQKKDQKKVNKWKRNLKDLFSGGGEGEDEVLQVVDRESGAKGSKSVRELKQEI